MKKFSRVLALVISVFFILSSFVGCGGSKDVHTGDTYTYWVALDNNVAQTHSSFNDLLMYREMEKITGTKVEFLHPAKGTTGTEAFQILLASGDFPDMIEFWWNQYPGGGDQAIEDGVIISLNKYMEEYAPNYYYWMEGKGGESVNYTYKASTLSQDGNYYGFKNLNVGKYRGFEGLYVRKDLLDKWGLDIPVTIDDWDNVLATAKKNGIKYPLTGTSSIVGTNSCYFSTAWGVGSSFYVDGDKVKFSPFEPAYKEYVKKMNEWYKKGYLDIDYVTNDSTIVNGYITNGTSIAANCYTSNIASLLSAMAKRNPEFNIAACPYPVLNEGDVPHFQAYQGAASEPTVVISAQCGIDNEDRYIEAIKWCDFLYSEEGMILKSFGVEGDTFTRETDENGEEHFVYTDKITKNYEDYGAHSVSAALYYHFLPANHPGFNQHPDYFKGYYPYPQQIDAIETWNKYVDVAAKYVYPEVTYTNEESSEIANIESKGKDNLSAAISNMIIGKEPIDNYDKAIKAAKDAGYDKLLKIKQSAYNRHAKLMK